MIVANVGWSRSTQALTLIELLLTTALLLLLGGALVFSFSSLQSNRQLDEGLARLESLMGFARAHAANSGHTVHLTLESTGDESDPGNLLEITWEPDPFEQPGVFTNLTVLPSIAEAVNELVRVEKHVEPDTGLEDATELLMADEEAREDELTEASFEASEEAALAAAEEQTVIRYAFFPDGSSESASFIVTSRDPEDKRRFLVELIGLTGRIRAREVDENNLPIREDEIPNDLEEPLLDEGGMYETNSAPSAFNR